MPNKKGADQIERNVEIEGPNDDETDVPNKCFAKDHFAKDHDVDHVFSVTVHVMGSSMSNSTIRFNRKAQQ